MKSRPFYLAVLMLAAAFAGGSLVSIGHAQKPQLTTNVLQAEAFVLVDKSGNARAALSVSPDDAVALDLRDVEGRPRVHIASASGGAPEIVLYDEEGKPGLRAELSAGSGAALTLLDGGSPPVPRISFGSGAEEDGATVVLSDRKGHPRAWFGLDDDGSPSLILLDGNQQGRAVLGCARMARGSVREADRRPVSSLILLDENRNMVFHAP